MPTNGDKAAIISAPWVWDGNFQYESSCADSCANVCADFSLSYEEDDIALAAARYGALDYVEVATCAANTINIDWNPDNGGDHTQNMCLYDGAITLPDDPVKPGFTFAGWKLVE